MYYSVKLTDPQKQSNSVTSDGYIGFNNARMLYSRGEALKKARFFNGKIEAVTEYNHIGKDTMITIPANVLTYGVRQLLRGRELFASTESNTNNFIYANDIFLTIRQELRDLEKNDKDFKTKDEIANQLDELIQITIDSNFVLINNMCFS